MVRILPFYISRLKRKLWRRELLGFKNHSSNVVNQYKHNYNGDDSHLRNFHFLFLQGIFRNFDDAFLPVLKPHLERLVADSHESTQRCVAEIIAGLIRGSKHWTFEKVVYLYSTFSIKATFSIYAVIPNILGVNTWSMKCSVPYCF